MNKSTKALYFGLLALVCFIFSNGVAHADNIYVSFSPNVILEIHPIPPITQFASTGLSGPAGLAFNGANLYVANFSNNTIEVFNSAGHGSVFASTGLNKPVGLAFDKSGNLYVANEGNNTIEKFNSSAQGTLFASTGLAGPTGLAFDTNGNLFVTNPLNDTIEKFNSNGVGTVFANLASGLNVPQGLAFDKNGNLFVSNVGVDAPNANSVVEFNSAGAGTNFASGLSQPGGLAFDSSGNLYVVETGSGRVDKIDTSGNRTPGTFLPGGTPVGIAIQVPEPATWALVALGAATLLGSRQSRRRSL
jgi:sugar lactone lactonase YvrE